METVRLVELTARTFGLTPEEANGVIMAGRVFCGHVPLDKAGMSLAADTVLTLKEKPRRYASRSGYKLEKALTRWQIDPKGLTACDIGASNGGFTDCMLQNGAAHVFAVDVAYGILDWKLRCDERVTVLERTNARNLTVEQLSNTLCDLVTADVCFISLSKIYPAIDRVLKPDGRVVTLIKPQFEAPKKALGKNGTLKDPSILPALLGDLFDAAAAVGIYVKGVCVSPIHGTNGNVEYLAMYDRSVPATAEERETWIRAALEERPDADT